MLVGDAFRCACWYYTTKFDRPHFEGICWPHTIGSSAAGAEAHASHSCRKLLTPHPDWAVSDNVTNCQSELPRSHVAAALNQVPMARELVSGITDLLLVQARCRC